MSAIALFIQIPVSAIEGLRKAAVPTRTWYGKPQDHYWEYLRQHGRETVEFHWSGYVFNSLLVYLEEKHGILLESEKGSEYHELAEFLWKARGSSFAVLTPAQRDAYAERLDPALFPDEELIAFDNEFNGRDDGAEALEAMKAGIDALRKALNQLEDGYITLFIIG